MTQEKPDQRRRPAKPLSASGALAGRLLEGGLNRGDLRHAEANGTAIRPAWGIYVAAESVRDPQRQERAVLQALTADGRRIVSHESAASLWGFSDRPLKRPFHLTSLAGAPQIQRPGLVISHRGSVPDEFLRWWNRIRVVSPAWAWLDVALRSSEEDALVLADQVLSVRIRRPGLPSPLAGRHELEEALRVRGRANGIRAARSAVDLASDAVDSRPETRLRYAMHRAGLPVPEVNPLVCDERGARCFRPDLALREWRLAIQYEGAAVHSMPERVLQDVRRQETAELLGWTEVRITKDHMRNGGAPAVQKILGKLCERGYLG
ncbi:hypothetical protein [Nesterenkonia populi]